MSHTVENDDIQFKILAMGCSYNTRTTSNLKLISMPNSSLKDSSTLTPMKAMGYSYRAGTTSNPIFIPIPKASLRESSNHTPIKARSMEEIG